MAVLWAVIFCVSCEYLKANGRAIMILVTMQFLGLAALCVKVLSVLLTYSASFKVNVMCYFHTFAFLNMLFCLQDIFPTVDWSEFMIDTNCWFSAAQEVFLTWALLSCSVISIFSKAKYKQPTHLRRDAILVTVLTMFCLLLAAALGNGCAKVLNLSGYLYIPGSFGKKYCDLIFIDVNCKLKIFLFQRLETRTDIFIHSISHCPSSWLSHLTNG